MGLLAARWVLVGEDFRYGARRAGDFASLAAAAGERGFELEAMPTVTNGGVRVSSSAVRDALASGRPEAGRRAARARRTASAAASCTATKLGRALGFADRQRAAEAQPPAARRHLRRARRGRGATGRCDGVASLGVRPTVHADGRPVLEVHLFDFDGDLYGRHLRVEFLAKIRDEERYADLDTLKAQIARDCDAARALLTIH